MSEPPNPPSGTQPGGPDDPQSTPPSYQPPGYEPPPHRPQPHEQPPYQQPQPQYQQPTYQQPQYPPGGYQQPGYQQPGYQQPGYQQPGYQQPGYQQGGYQQGGYPAPPAASFASRLGPRVLRRPDPRFSISLGGAGAALVLIGVLVWSVGYLVNGVNFNFSDNGDVSTPGTSRRFLGAALFLILAAAGYALVILRRRGPLATTGIVCGAVAVPFVLIFLTFDLGNILRGELPFNVDAVYIVSIIVWLGSYLLVPGARGRAFLLGASAAGLAAYVGLKAASSSFGRSAVSTVSGGGFHSSGTDSLAAVGLIFGLAYYAIAAVLDRRGHSGAGVALAYAAFGTTVGGVVAAAPSFGQVGTGILLVVLGLVLCWYGGHNGRRFTSWAWAVGLVVGIGLLVAKATPHSYTGGGISLIVIGAVVAVAAHVVANTTNEQPEMAEDLQPPARVF